MLLSTKSIAIRRQFSYVAGGAANSIATFIIYQGLNLVINYRAAFTLAFASGIVFSLIYNARMVFRSAITVRRSAQFFCVYLAQYFVSLQFLSLLVEHFGVNAALAPLFVMAVIVPCTYLAVRS